MPSSVFFKPPLFLQRQQWILTELALHRVKNILEVGCGDAPILKQVLAQPLWIDPPEEWRQAFVETTGLKSHKFIAPPTVAPQLYTAIDIDHETLKLAAEHSLRVYQYEGSSGQKVEPRWESMRVQFVHGSLTEDYSAFAASVDAIVACEVIEHLDDNVLEQFARVLLGMYRPNIMLVTTPNFGFNDHFNLSDGRGFKDPTGRTDRIFRHHDHRFEWTTEEFDGWCKSICANYPYDYKIGGVGIGYKKGVKGTKIPAEYSGPCAEYASQHAIFTRTLDKATPTCLPCGPLPMHSTSEPLTFDRLGKGTISTLDFPATHEPSNSTAEEIAIETRAAILHRGTLVSLDGADLGVGESLYGASLWDLWMDDDLRKLCSGRLDKWLPALDMFSALQKLGISWRAEDGEVFLTYKLTV